MIRKFACSLGLLVLTLVSGALPLLGGDITLGGTFSGDVTLTPTVTDGVYTQSFAGQGYDSNFNSNFDVSSSSTVDFSSPSSLSFSDGTFTLTLASSGGGSPVMGNPDGTGALTGSVAGTGTIGSGGAATFTVSFTITGATGQFTGLAGSMGSATVTGTLTPTGPNTQALGNGAYSGSLSPVPEPSAAILMASSLAVMAFGLGLRGSSRAS